MITYFVIFNTDFNVFIGNQNVFDYNALIANFLYQSPSVDTDYIRQGDRKENASIADEVFLKWHSAPLFQT